MWSLHSIRGACQASSTRKGSEKVGFSACLGPKYKQKSSWTHRLQPKAPSRLILVLSWSTIHTFPSCPYSWKQTLQTLPGSISWLGPTDSPTASTYFSPSLFRLKIRSLGIFARYCCYMVVWIDTNFMTQVVNLRSLWIFSMSSGPETLLPSTCTVCSYISSPVHYPTAWDLHFCLLPVAQQEWFCPKLFWPSDYDILLLPQIKL